MKKEDEGPCPFYFPLLATQREQFYVLRKFVGEIYVGPISSRKYIQLLHSQSSPRQSLRRQTAIIPPFLSRDIM